MSDNLDNLLSIAYLVDQNNILLSTYYIVLHYVAIPNSCFMESLLGFQSQGKCDPSCNDHYFLSYPILPK